MCFAWLKSCVSVCSNSVFCMLEIGCFIVYVADNSVSYVKHPSLHFLRRVFVTKAITALRNLGLYPFKTEADSMPDKFSVDNFAHFKVVFHVYYCYLEGKIFHVASACVSTA